MYVPFEYKAKFEKKAFLFRSEISIFDIFFKKFYEKSIEDLKINSNWKFQTRATMSYKMAFKVFVKIQKSPPLIANIVKSSVSGLTRFLATKSPWKVMKNAFYFIWKALFVLKISKFLSWLFGHVEKTVSLEREG